MANEIALNVVGGGTVYCLIMNMNNQLWHTGNAAFEAYATGNYASYAISATQQGSTGIYLATFPAAISPGVYRVRARRQAGGSPVEGDSFVATHEYYQWGGSQQLSTAHLIRGV